MGYNFPGTRVDLGGGRGWLDAPAAASIFRIDRAIGHRCQISEAGRTWEQQMRFWQIFQAGGNIALHPDTPSEHQKGKAVDSNEAQQFVALMEEHGWRRTVYRWVNGVWTLVERWHFEYFVHLDKHINDGAPASDTATTIPSEEDDMYDDAAKQDAKTRHTEIMTALEKVHRAAAPFKVLSWGTGLVVINPQNGKLWILPEGYSDLLTALGLVGGNPIPANTEQLGFATGFLPAAIGDSATGGDGFTSADLSAIKDAIAQAQVAVTPEQLKKMTDAVGAAARTGGEQGAVKALQDLTFVVSTA